MKHLFSLVAFSCAFLLHANDEAPALPQRHHRDLQSRKQQSIQFRKLDIFSHIDFEFEDHPLAIMTGFSGKAYYAYPVALAENNDERIVYNMGGGYASAESELEDYSYMDNTCASAEMGVSFESDVSEKTTTSWGVGLSQPVYDSGGSSKPTLSLNYGIKY